jgi:ribosomal-protein-alanine N-acetyltransferase
VNEREASRARAPAVRRAVIRRAVIRRAVAGDAAALAALAAAALPEPWSEAGFAEEIGRAEARVWLARDAAGELVGYLAAHRVLDELQLLSLAVAADRRRGGTGRALVERAVASEPGLCAVHLEVRSNDAAAHAFYARVGFRAVGVRRGFYRDGGDAWLLTRPARLGAAS